MHKFVGGHHPLFSDLLPFRVEILENGEKRAELRSLCGSLLRGLVSRLKVDGVGLLNKLRIVVVDHLIYKGGRLFHECVDLLHSCFLL